MNNLGWSSPQKRRRSSFLYIGVFCEFLAPSDEFIYQDGIKTTSNNNGGINGGISNGMPIILKTVIKPTPSISKEQNTVDLLKNQNTTLKLKGRHDPCIVHRARVVIDSMVAIGILDLYVQRFGYEWM